MALRILTSANYPEVRQVIRLDLTAAKVTDAMIEATTMGGAAEREILRRDPLALTYAPTEVTSDPVKWAHIQAAAIFLTAANLAPAVPPPPTQETEAGEYEYTRPTWKPQDRVTELLANFETEMTAYLSLTTDAYDVPTLFTTVGPPHRPPHAGWGYRRWGF